jgi:tripartite-type tricarboxylate transporter receptor subunit TctC
MKRTLAIALVGLSVMTMPALGAEAQKYPAKPVRIIVPGPAGGGLDVIARNVVQQLTTTGRGQFYIENLPGAGGSIGTGGAATATADGYTILVTNQDFVIHPLIKAKVPYDPFKSFTPVTLVAIAPEVVAVTPSLPASTMQELFTLLRAHPGKYNYATPGYGREQIETHAALCSFTCRMSAMTRRGRSGRVSMPAKVGASVARRKVGVGRTMSAAAHRSRRGRSSL